MRITPHYKEIKGWESSKLKRRRDKATPLRKKVQVLLCIVAVVHVNCQTCVREREYARSNSKVKLYVFHDSLVCESKT